MGTLCGIRPFILNIIFTILFVVVAIIVIVPTAMDYQKQDAESQYATIHVSKNHNNTRLYMNVKIVSVDFLTGTFKMHIDMGDGSFDGNGTLFDPLGFFLKKNLNIIFGPYAFTFPQGKTLPSQDMTFNFDTGEYSNYPFDKWTYGTAIIAWVGTNVSSADSQLIPIDILTYGTVPTLRINAVYNESLDNDPLLMDVAQLMITVSRNGITRGFSIFIVIIMWLLSISCAVITYQVIILGREVGPPNLAAFAAILFAMANVRGTQPLVPPIGALIDVVGYIWNIVIVALCTITLIACWVYRYKVPIPTEAKV